jgi:hypothetical protein
MKHLLLVILVVLTASFSCEKTDVVNDLENTDQKALLIGFNPDKCYCCWGWELKVGNDTIKSDFLPGIDITTYTEGFPQEVSLIIGKEERDCSAFLVNHFKYYEIEKITLLK